MNSIILAVLLLFSINAGATEEGGPESGVVFLKNEVNNKSIDDGIFDGKPMLCEYRLYLGIKGHDRQHSHKILEIRTADGRSQLYLYISNEKIFKKIDEIKIKQNDYKFVYREIAYRFCCSIGVAHVVVD